MDPSTQTPRILALIPARGGSKGLPRKNVLPVAGRPLIAWTISQALSSESVGAVVVSTDDSEIADVAARFGAEVPFMRPDELATDTSPSIDAVLHALDALAAHGREFDMIALLEPTSPLRAADDIDRAVSLLMAHPDADAVVSVGQVHTEHPAIMKRLEDDRLVSYIPVVSDATRRQELAAAYFPYGVVYLSRVDSLRRSRSFYPERTIPMFIERWQNYEIDDMYDLLCVNAVLEFRQRESSR